MVSKMLVLILIVMSSWAQASVKAYFNHNPNAQYTDPYRNIQRSGDNLEQVILDQIKNAKKSIFLAVQELRLPLVAQALIDKKNQGLDVRVILEHDYNFTVLTGRDPIDENEYEVTKLNELRALVDINRDGKFSKDELQQRDAIYMLNKSEVEIMDDTFDSSRGSGLMHHKFMVVDGKSVLVSTANFTLSCIHGDMLVKTSRGNANSMVVINSTVVGKAFSDEFSQMWGNGKRGNFGHNKTYRGPQTFTVRNTKITVQFSPTSARYNWEESVNGLIGAELAKAKKSVQALLFVFSDQKISNLLEKKSQKGVNIGFIIEPKFAYREYSELLDLLGVQLLDAKCSYEPDNNPWKSPIASGGMALLTKGDVLHHKFAVVDAKTVVVGSQNWSDAANYVNDETLIVIEDKQISDQYGQEYERVQKNALMGVPAYLKKEIKRLETECTDRGLYF